eukprot:sb/3469715/
MVSPGVSGAYQISSFISDRLGYTPFFFNCSPQKLRAELGGGGGRRGNLPSPALPSPALHAAAPDTVVMTSDELLLPPPDQAPEDAVEGSQDLEKVVEVPLTGTGLEDNKVGPESFDMITVLGQGSFGKSSILGEATPPAVVVLVLVKLWFGISRGEREFGKTWACSFIKTSRHQKLYPFPHWVFSPGCSLLIKVSSRRYVPRVSLDLPRISSQSRVPEPPETR